MKLLLKNRKTIEVNYLAGTDGLHYNYCIQQQNKTFFQSFGLQEFVNSIFTLNIGLNVGEREPDNQLLDSVRFVQGLTNVLKAKHAVIYTEQRTYISSYEGKPERVLVAKYVMNTPALCYISDLLQACQIACKTLNQECIALRAGESGALVYANYIDTTNFDNHYFKQF